ETLLLRGSRERPVYDTHGVLIGSELTCPDGRLVRIAPGWEGTHTMPLGLGSYPAAALGTPTVDATPLADLRAAVDAVHPAGGIFFTAHSEELELSAATLAAAGGDGMEWYNVHGNFKALLGGDTVGENVDLAHVKA